MVIMAARRPPQTAPVPSWHLNGENFVHEATSALSLSLCSSQ